ncbi:peripheral-type benzodiazepine receptor-associated protein 1 isoform X2 [Hyla sarda]|uniref:peripheral-type benzodiazepine receptor-associated protein 1 isoform X2 n=1 Tax=Hyla sarda TaxID=327740 RepID=UPI0024C37E20|nr:peripheral-type benzodiazepine receptor-associated protein 1 isoform X2 [Hyla sarda]
MLKEGNSNFRFSPKKSENILAEEYKRELELVKKELESEKLRTQDARKRCTSELKQFKETFQKQKRKLVDDLKSKLEQQKTRELQQIKESVLRERELEIKQLIRWKDEELKELQTLLQKERDTAVRQARELQKQLIDELLNKGYTTKSSNAKKYELDFPSASECQCRLQDVLSKIRWEYDGEQAARIRHLKLELELAKNLFIKYILDSNNSSLLTILKGKSKPLNCGEIKFGRYSLGSRTTRPWSLDEVSLGPDRIENVRHRPQLSRAKSLECMIPEHEYQHTNEKFLEFTPETEIIVEHNETDCHENHTSYIAPYLDTKNDFLTSYFFENEVNELCENMKESGLDISTVTGDNNCTTSVELLDSSQSHGVQNVDSLQLSPTRPSFQKTKELRPNTLVQSIQKRLVNISDSSPSAQGPDLPSALQELEQRCKDLKEENIILRKSSIPETEEKVKRLKRKNAELAVIAKRLEERAQKLQEANLKMVNTPIHLRGAGLELCKKAFARQRAKDMSEQASALLAKDKQIETLKQECQELQAKLSGGKDFPNYLKLNDFNRLLHESQKEVLRLQRQIAMKYLKESLNLSRVEAHSSPKPSEMMCLRMISSEQPTQDPDNSIMTTSMDSVQEVELSRKRKECELLEQEVTKKQKRCEELELKVQEVQKENACLVEENSRLCIRVKRVAKVDSENADLKRRLTEVTEQRDSALKEIHRLQSKLENLEQVLKLMRDVAERRQQLEKDHEDALIALQKRQEEVKRLQQAQVEAKKEHEGAVQLLENTLDSLQSKVKLLEEKCRSQTEQFSLLSQELERFRLQTGNIDLLTSTFVTSELPPPQYCSSPGLTPVQQERVNEKTKDEEKKQIPEAPEPSHNVANVGAPIQPLAKENQKLETPHNPSKSESTPDSSKSCPTPEVDTASEMEELEADSISLNPEPETRSSAKLQVFLARYSYNPFDGPNENPEAELPLTAGEYIYIYGEMDDDGFFEGELMDGRRGLVPSNFVERVSDDDMIAFHPAETNELSRSSGQDISFLSGSSIERSEEDDDGSSLSPLPMQGNSEGARDVSAVPYPRKLTLIKQLARSIVVGWDPPLVAAGSGNILSYNIYVDNELRQNVRCGGQTKALIEKLELKTRTYRISVQSMTDSGCSDRMRCTLLVGHGYTLAPTQLRVRSLSATSAEITWQPCNSNYSHALYLNEESCGLAKAGTYWYTFSNLRPSTMYNVKVEARPQRIPLELPLERREPKTTVMQLTTPAAGPPDAPLDVQVELGPKPGVLLITWLPVTIDAAGTSNGVRVTGYAVYADGQKVLEVTSPTAGSVLVGTSHLQLLQVSREISVRTMSPSGESMDSVPAHIPSAFLKVPDSPSLSHTFSISSLICEQASGQNLSSHCEKSPSMPLTTSSPCSLHNLPASASQANSPIYTNCIRGDSIDSLPVRASSLSASSGYCQGSSSSEPAEVHLSCQGAQNHFPSTVPEVARTEHTLQSVTALQEHSQENIPNTKEPEINSKVNTSALPMGITWCKENSLELNTTAKEECSSPETELPEDAETTNLSCRGVSIEDFLEVDRNEKKEPSMTVSYDTEDTVKLQLDKHSSVHLDHSRSSNLSDILEEEEDVDEEDCNVIPSAKKWGQPSTSTSGDCSVKLDCCETDSDEEILEKILDLPLQKHCSKKLFSIPEVTEEEDEEEASPSPHIVSKNLRCNMKYQYGNSHKDFSSKLGPVSCSNFPTETPIKVGTVNNKKMECGEDSVFLDEDFCPKLKGCVYQAPSDVMPPVSETQMWKTKRNSYDTDRTCCFTEPNRKKQNDSREHCSRMSQNSNQSGFYNSKSYKVKESVSCGTARDTSQANHQSLKNKPSRNPQRRRLLGSTNCKPKALSSFSSRHLEIDVEYDTEDEDEPSFPAPTTSRPKADLWEDGSQTDKEGWSESSGYSEPIQHTRRKNYVKRPMKEQNAHLKGTASLPHAGLAQLSCNKDDPVTRAANRSMRSVRWQCDGKEDFIQDSKVQLQLSPTRYISSDRKSSSHLISDSESDAAYSTQPECSQEKILEDRDCPVKEQEADSVRLFVALFDYDPETMSPNPEAYMEELQFKEGQILQVFGDKDSDGFYQGKYAESTGYIPCNMVSELHIENEEDKMQLLRQGHMTSASLLIDLVQCASAPEENNASGIQPKNSKSDLSSSLSMVAIFDYNPKESSPNLDVEAELSFTAGDVITVFGPMDEDGFYYGELNGQRGLVPSNYLELSQAQTAESTCPETVHKKGEKEFDFDAEIAQPSSLPVEPNEQAVESKENSEKTDVHQGIASTKKKKSFFSKGRKLFKKLGSSGKNL